MTFLWATRAANGIKGTDTYKPVQVITFIKYLPK